MKKTQNDFTHSIALGTAIIIVALVIVFGAVFYWMWSMDMLFLPSFVENIFGIGDDNADQAWDLGELSSLVKDGKTESGERVVFDISYENLRKTLLSKERESGIHLTADVKYFSNGEEFSRKIVYSQSGAKYRIEQYNTLSINSQTDSKVETLKISDGENLYILDCASGVSRYVPITEDISPENEAGIPCVDMLMEVIDSFPKQENGDIIDGSGIEDTSLKLLRTDRGNVYYIAFTYSDIGLTEEYYVSLNHRIIIFASSRQNGKEVYLYSTSHISTDSEDYSNDTLYSMSETH